MPRGYFKNINKPISGMLGKRHTEETKKKMRLVKKGIKPKNWGSIQGMRKGIKWTMEEKQKISGATKLAMKKPEVKLKLSNSHKGLIGYWKNKKRPPFSEEWKRKIIEKSIFQKGEKHWNWKGGISFIPYTTDWTETLRRSIRERDHYICRLCLEYGNTVHHIDYNKKNCNPENLITLCMSCNAKVNFNRDYWLNYFKG